MTVTIGWLEDEVEFTGGAELSGSTLRDGAPDWAEVIPCPPNYRPPERIELFVIQNNSSYTQRWIGELALRPVVKTVRDPWYSGSSLLRRWLLENAELLIFSSPVQVDAFEYPSDLPYKLVPPPVDLDLFREAAMPDAERRGNVFVGRCDVFKGAHAAVDWALRNGEPLDLYGLRGFGDGQFLNFGNLPNSIEFHGQVPYKQMPYILGEARRFVFFPTWPEAFGRTVVEAWASGCDLLIKKDRIGSWWWIENEPEALERGVELFWDAIEEVVE